ncbi:MAG: hypothetical protein AAGI25_07880 [Bacteroidota bacterium]
MHYCQPIFPEKKKSIEPEGLEEGMKKTGEEVTKNAGAYSGEAVCIR